MFEQVLIVAANEIRVLMREKTFLLLLSVFLTMTLFSVFIGWSTKTTVLGIYNASLILLKQSGTTYLPSNPFVSIPALALFRNMIIYVFLIGALTSIVIGHRSFIRERKSRVVQLLFTKPVSKTGFIAGKIVGILAALLLIMLVVFFISLLSSLFIPGQQLTQQEIIRLGLFYLLSLMYMLIFAMMGLLFAIILPTESLALLAPIIIWVVVTFIFPELTTGQNPVALLNPTNITQAAPQGAFFTLMHTVLTPFSIEQHYTGLAQPLLETKKQFISLSATEIISKNGSLCISLFVYLISAITLSLYTFYRYTVTKDKMYE